MKFFIKALTLLCLTASLQAQDIPEALDPRINEPYMESNDLAGVVQSRGFSPNALAVKAGEVIDGRNWDDQNIADEYTKYTGKRVLLSSATQGVEIRFFQRGPLTNREASELLVKVLDMEGYVFVSSGNEVKLVTKSAGGGPNGASELEKMIDQESDIPLGDDYISYFMKFDYIKPDEAVRTFTQSLHGLGSGAKLAPVANASALIVTGKASFIRKLLNQKKYIDVPAGSVENEWVTLRYADAGEVAATLNEIVNATQQSKTTAGVKNNAATKTNNAPPVPGNNATTSNASTSGAAAGETIPVQIVADTRLNKIFIMGRQNDVNFVKSLAHEFDLPPAEANSMRRKLSFMIAGDFFDVAVQALEALNSASKAGGGEGGGSGSNSTGSAQNRSQQGNNSSSGNSSSGSSSSSGGSVSEFNVSDKPQATFVGKWFIVADNLANRIIVQGPPEGIRVVSDLIDQLDTKPQQVMISTVFGKISLVDGMETGMDFGYFKNNLAGGNNSNGNLSDIIDLTTGGLGSGLNIYGAYKDFTGALQLLETNSNFKTLSKPTVFTSNNRVAVIESGERIAVPTNTVTNTTSDTTTANIEYRDVLLKFEVVALINSDDEVTLQISLLNESAQETQEVSGIEVPTIATESITTTVTVPNNATIVLGGLVTETVSDNKSGIPVLSSIPGIGRLFGSNSESIDRSELLLFIKPTIIKGDVTLHNAQSDLERGYDVSKSSREYMNSVLPSRSDDEDSYEEKSTDFDSGVKRGFQQLGRGSQFRH